MSGFTTSNGKVYDPSGNVFVARGVDVLFGGNDPSAATLKADFPGINFVRLAVYNYESPQTLATYVNTLTQAGLVVELENHNNNAGGAGGGQGTIFTGSALTTEQNWYSSVASYFKSNPNVWFGTNNEPSETDPNTGQTNAAMLSDWQLQTYNSVRNAGNTAPVMLEVSSWGPGNTNVGYKASDYSGMTNVIWDMHYYGWLSGFSTDQNTVTNTFNSLVNDTHAITGANGVMPVIIGEYGNSTDGNNVDANGNQVIAAVQNGGVNGTAGNVAWAWLSGLGGDALINGDSSLTSYGQQIASVIAKEAAAAPAPAPKNFTPSASGSVVLAGSTGSITDSNGDKWTIVNGAVYRNGAAADYTSGVAEIAYVNGVVWQENTSGLWWSWAGGWTGGAGTSTSPLPPPPSANDTTVLAGSTAAIVDATGNKWTITTGGQVAVNGVADTNTANVIELAYVNGTVWQENTNKNWWGWSNGGWNTGAGTTTSPLPVATTPTPPTTTATKPLVGAYTYIPDAWNTANNTQFQTTYNQFTSLMGAKPAVTTVGIDYSQPISGWVGSASEEAQSYAKSGDTYQIMTVGMPLYSNASGAGTADSQFKAFAAGTNDATIKSIVDAWASQGFGKNGQTLDFRLGWEMNLYGTPTYTGGAANNTDWLAAYKHVYTVLHQEATADGINLRVVWNPGTENNTTIADITPLFPGANYVDVIGVDTYAGGQNNDLPQFLTWAEQQGKPFAVEETGAGTAANPGDTADNATFPQWLAGQLSTAQAAGLNTQYVTIWDGQTDEFSNGTKPNEAAAWKQYFGANATASPPVTTSPPPTTTPPATPSANDTVVKAGATTAIVDAAGNKWTITSAGQVAVNGVADTTTGGVVELAYVNGTVWQENASAMWWGKTSPTAAWGPSAGTSTSPLPPTTATIALRVSEDAYQGDAQFTVKVDGTQVGGTLTASALHSAGDSNVFTLTGNWASGTHQVAIQFLNDAYGGSAATDRNLYVDSIAYNGTTQAGTTLSMPSAGTQTFTVGSNVATLAAPADTVTLHLSEDAYQGDAQFQVLVDSKAVTTPQAVTTLHSSGAWQDLSFAGNFGTGSHTIGVQFLNDAYGGSATADRNMYVNGIDVNGTHYGTGVTSLLSASTANFMITTAH